MLRNWLLLCVIVSSAYAYDPHLSIIANASPAGLFNPGVSLEYANSFGTRTVIASEIGVTEPNDATERAVVFTLSGRLLYSTGLTSQWYPQTSLTWNSNNNQIDPWLGIGFQKEVIPEAGYFLESHWRPQSEQVLIKLGLRIWLERFSSIDNRIRSSVPLGAVYRAGNPVNSKNTILLDAPDEAEVQSEQSLTPEPKKVQLAQQEPPMQAISQTETTKIEHDNGAMAEDDAWYVHLGLFGQLESMTALEEDARLVGFRAKLAPWFDPGRSHYRLLLGPYEKQQAQGILVQIKQSNLDGFLFQKPK